MFLIAWILDGREKRCFSLKLSLSEALLLILPRLQTIFLPEEGTIISSGLQEDLYFEKGMYLEGKTCL